MNRLLIALLLTGQIAYLTTEGYIGIRISGTHVNYVHPGSPAEKADIHVKDIILAVDGKKGDTAHITGQPGTSVHLKLLRGAEFIEVDVTRMDRGSIRP